MDGGLALNLPVDELNDEQSIWSSVKNSEAFDLESETAAGQ